MCSLVGLRVLGDVKKKLRLVICKDHNRRLEIFLEGRKRTDQELCGSDYRQPVVCSQSLEDGTLGMSQGFHKPAMPLRPAPGKQTGVN